MATGRGQFFFSLRQGLERIQPGRHGGEPSRKEEPARAGSSMRRRCHYECPKPPAPPHQSACCPAPSWALPPRMNYFERLPPEVILKILSYLDLLSLFSVGFVNRKFHELANDNVIWYKLYSCEMARRKWRPKLYWMSDPARDDVQSMPAAVWKRLLFSEMGCRMDGIWKKELRNVDLNTGMPAQTEQILRSLDVVWEITLTNKKGNRRAYTQSWVFFFNSSVTVCWSGGEWPRIYSVYSVQLHGVLGLPTARPTKPPWRSLISKTHLNSEKKWRVIGSDKLVKLIQVDEGITVGVWRGTWTIAFIMATLHFHKLVERSVLGSPFCPYRPEEFGSLHSSMPLSVDVHGYTVLVLLHTSVRRIMQWRFSSVLCTRETSRGEFVWLHPIQAGARQKQTPISGKISLPWKSGKLQGDVENCCMITVSVLAEVQRPVWCISSSACLLLRHSKEVWEIFDRKQFALSHCDADGKLWMTLEWVQDLQLYFLLDLSIRLNVRKVHSHL